MYSFTCYRDLILHLQESGRAIQVYVTISLRGKKPRRYLVDLDAIKYALDHDLCFRLSEKQELKFADVHGRRFKAHMYAIYSLKINYVAVHSKDGSSVLKFSNYKSILNHLNKTMPVILKISLWTHSSKRMIHRVSFNQIKDYVTPHFNFRYGDFPLAFTDTEGNDFNMPMSKMRIAKLDSFSFGQ